jgi:Rad3-related DNA helicase
LILEAIDSPAWYHTAGVTDDGGIALHHRLPGRLLKKIANQPNTAFVSATLTIGGKFDDFKRALGIADISRHSGMLEPKAHGELHFHIDTSHPVNSEEWVDQVKLRILEAPRSTLVVTPSHDLANQLGEMNPEGTVRSKDETTADAALRMGESTLLIAAGAWAGLDTVMQWRSVIVPRIPFPCPTVLDDQVEGH